MCRSSTKSIGLLLLLWIGIFLPVTEYQVSHLGGIGSLIGVASNGDTAAPDKHAQPNKQTSKSDRYAASAGIDLTDFTLVVAAPEPTSKSESLPTRRISDGFTSRDLPPEERPPISLAA
ncbi:MAG: hypothetical protein ACK4TP_07475 [Hyphomicrobium sp.]|jgi:hypothetical protein